MLTADDRRAIDDLHARFCHAADDADVHGWLQVFSADGAIVVGGIEWRGESGLTEFIRTNGGLGRHLISNAIVIADGDIARGRSYVLFARRPDEGALPQLNFVGVYVDEFIREGGDWKIQRRTVLPGFGEH